MTHKEILASLSVDQRRQLTRRSNKEGMVALLIHAGLILFFGILLILQVPGWPILLLPQGILLVFLFTLLHEVTHNTAFKSKRANKFLAALCGWLLFLPPNWFRYFHFAHHRYTQDPCKDPELQSPKPVTKIAYLWHVSGLPVAASNFSTLLRNSAGRCKDEYVPLDARALIAAESRLMLCGYILVALICVLSGTWSAVLTGWIIPLIIGQPFLRLYLMAEHGGCAFVDDMFSNTRTVFTHQLVCRLAWNMPYHAEHHAYPNVPFHQLPDFHRIVQKQLLVTADGYRRFHQEMLRDM